MFDKCIYFLISFLFSSGSVIDNDKEVPVAAKDLQVFLFLTPWEPDKLYQTQSDLCKLNYFDHSENPALREFSFSVLFCSSWVESKTQYTQ